MLYFVPFEAEHFEQMKVQAAQRWMQGNLTVVDLRGLEGPYAVTLMQDGVPVLCGGAMQYWAHRALVWAFLSDRVNRENFMGVTIEVRRFLDGLPFRRLEASVDVGFANGHRWMKALGFTVETPLQRAFQVSGQDSVGYVRIKD